MEFHEAEDIGHSRDYHDLHIEGAWDTMFQTWKRQHQNQEHAIRMRRDATGSWFSIEEIERYIESFKPAFTSAQESLLVLINKTAVLTGRLKSATSLQEKMTRKNLTTLDELTDVIGLRITSQTVDEALKIKDKIRNATKQFNITETSCYGMCPGSEKYRSSGYRRIHLIINIKEHGSYTISSPLIALLIKIWCFPVLLSSSKRKNNPLLVKIM